MMETVDLFEHTTFGGDGHGRLKELLGPPQPLFSREDFGEVLHGRTSEMLREMHEYRANELLNTGTERLLDYFDAKYSIDVPMLDEQNRSMQHHEVEIDAGGRCGEQPTHLPGFRYKITVPFTSDPPVSPAKPPIRAASSYCPQ